MLCGGCKETMIYQEASADFASFLSQQDDTVSQQDPGDAVFQQDPSDARSRQEGRHSFLARSWQEGGHGLPATFSMTRKEMHRILEKRDIMARREN
jgi:hypothetical protein